MRRTRGNRLCPEIATGRFPDDADRYPDGRAPLLARNSALLRRHVHGEADDHTQQTQVHRNEAAR